MNVPQLNVIAVGRAASDLRLPLSQMLEIASRLGITPAMQINNVPYLNAADVERIAAQVRAIQSPSGIIPREPIF